MQWKRGAWVAILCAGTSVMGGTAAAHATGVTVDPNSPAGKEYAIPLQAVRGQFSGGGGSSSGPADPARTSASPGGQAAPLFGVGISPRGNSTRTATRGRAGSRAADGAAVYSPRVAGSGSVSGTAVDAGIIGGILLLGLGLGAVMRLRGGEKD